METRKNHGVSKRRTRRLRRNQKNQKNQENQKNQKNQKNQVGGGMRVEKWVETLRSHPAYKQNKENPFDSLDYSFTTLKESMKIRDLSIDPHDVQSGNDDDDLSRLDPNGRFETPSYMYDVGATLAFLMAETLNEQSATPAKFAALINAMKEAGGNNVGSLEYMTDAENLLRLIVGQLPDSDILSKTDKYPLFIWGVVMNLKPDGNNAVPEPKVPALFTKQAEAEPLNPEAEAEARPEPTE